MCTPELLHTLEQISTTLFELIVTCDSVKLAVLKCWVDEALHHVITESTECLGTDDVLNGLQQLLETVFPAALTYHKNEALNHLQELATSVVTVRDQLVEEMEKIHDHAELAPTNRAL